MEISPIEQGARSKRPCDGQMPAHPGADRVEENGRMYDSYQQGVGLEPDVAWGDGRILCPRCGHDNIHITGVRVAARRHEDAPVTWVGVDAFDGAVDHEPSDTPDPRHTARQQIALEGLCEGGCVFALVFRQDHGCTYIDVASEAGDVCLVCNDLRHTMRTADGTVVCGSCREPITYAG